MIYGYLYRLVMKLAHRYDWHYAPSIGPLEDGKYQRWCKWCGFRESYTKHEDMLRDISITAAKLTGLGQEKK